MTGYRRLVLLATAGSALAGFVLFAAPVQAVVVPGTTLDIVAMGDSYTAGVGGSVPLTGADVTCRRTSTGYASVVAESLRQTLSSAVDLSLVACSGATTLSARTGSDTGPGLSGAPRAITSPDQLASIDAGTDLVVLTAGAGDTDLEAVLAACLVGEGPACTAAAAAGVALYDPARLMQLLAEVDARAGSRAPQDRLLIRVSGYVQPYDVQGIVGGGCPSGLSPTTAAAGTINDGVVALNQVIAGATAQAAAAALNSDVEFVSVDQRFADHRLCSLEPWLVRPTLTTVAARSALHPTDSGHVAYAAAVLSQSVELAPLLAGRLVPATTGTTTTAPTSTATTGPTTSTSATTPVTTTGNATTTAGASASTTSAVITISGTTSSAPASTMTTTSLSAVAGTTRTSAGALPTTGSTTAPLLVLGSILVVAGAAAAGLTRRRARPGRAG